MLTVTSAPGGADSKRSACGSGLIVIQPGTQEGAVALEHPESTRTMTPLAAMAATFRTRTRHPPDTAESLGCPPALVELNYEFHLEMWLDCCLGGVRKVAKRALWSIRKASKCCPTIFTEASQVYR